MRRSSLYTCALALAIFAATPWVVAAADIPAGAHPHQQVPSQAPGTSDAFGDIFEIEARLAGSLTDNLSKDWMVRTDRWETAGLTTRFYPLPWTELRFTGEYTAYKHALPLSNFTSQLGLTIIPTNPNAKTTVYFSANAKWQNYREMELEDTGASTSSVSRNDYPNRNYDLLLSVDRQLLRSLRVRTGFQFRATGYDAVSLHDKYEHQIFLGGNLALTKSTALDIEGGYRFGDYYHLVDSVALYWRIRLDRLTSASFFGNNLEWFYFSPRLSQSIGKRTGVSVTYLHRNFVRLEQGAFIWGNSVYVWNGAEFARGMTTSLISPWAGVYEGNTVTLKVKTYLVPKVTLSASLGYADKTFLTAHDGYRLNDTTGLPTIISPSTLYVKEGRGYRHDIERRYSVTILVPLPSRSGYYIEPSLKIDYADVDSNKLWYSYTAFGVSGEVKVKF
jgi:hypothetical protein